MMRSLAMEKAELLAVLDDMRARVEAGDSFEGSVEYLMPGPGDPEGVDFMVRGSYRVGNTDGQGGVRLVGDHDEPNPRDYVLFVLDVNNGAGLRWEAREQVDAPSPSAALEQVQAERLRSGTWMVVPRWAVHQFSVARVPSITSMEVGF